MIYLYPMYWYHYHQNVLVQPLAQYDIMKPEAPKSLYRSPGYKKNQLVLFQNYVLQW
jgi:hypothetical protein